MPRGEHLTRLIFFIKHPPDRERNGRAGAVTRPVASSEVLRNQKVSSGWWEMEKVMPLARPCSDRTSQENWGRGGHRPLLKLKRFPLSPQRRLGWTFGELKWIKAGDTPQRTLILTYGVIDFIESFAEENFKSNKYTMWNFVFLYLQFCICTTYICYICIFSGFVYLHLRQGAGVALWDFFSVF